MHHQQLVTRLGLASQVHPSLSSSSTCSHAENPQTLWSCPGHLRPCFIVAHANIPLARAWSPSTAPPWSLPSNPPPPAPHPDSAHPITEQGSLMSARRLPADSPAFTSPTHIPSCKVFRAHRALWHLQALVPHLPPSLEDSAQTKCTPRTPALSATPSPPSTQSQSAPENSGRGAPTTPPSFWSSDGLSAGAECQRRRRGARRAR